MTRPLLRNTFNPLRDFGPDHASNLSRVEDLIKSAIDDLIQQITVTYAPRSAAPGVPSAPSTAPYWLSTAVAALPNGVDMGALGVGVIQQTVALGVSTPQAFTGADKQVPYFGPAGLLVAGATWTWDAVATTMTLTPATPFQFITMNASASQDAAFLFNAGNQGTKLFLASFSYGQNAIFHNMKRFMLWSDNPAPSLLGVYDQKRLFDCDLKTDSETSGSSYSLVGNAKLNSHRWHGPTYSVDGALGGSTRALGVNFHVFEQPSIDAEVGWTGLASGTVVIEGAPLCSAIPADHLYGFWVQAGHVRFGDLVGPGFVSADVDGLLSVTAGSFVPTSRTVQGTAPIQIAGDNAAHDLSANRVWSHANTAVTPGLYTSANIIVDAMGHVTAAANGSAAGITQLTGDGTAGPGSGSQVFTLANVVTGATIITPASLTFNNKGLITAATALSFTNGSVISWSGGFAEDNAHFFYDGVTHEFSLRGGGFQAWYNATGANFERVRAFWSGNVWTLQSQQGGSGTVRSMLIDAGIASLSVLADAGLSLASTSVAITTETGGTGHNLAIVGNGGDGQLFVSAWDSLTLVTTHNSSIVADNKMVITGSPTLASATSLVGDAVKLAAGITLTGSNAVTRATGLNAVVVPRPGYAMGDAGAVTITYAASLYVANSPLAGSSVTITNPYALWIDDGATRLDGDLILPTVANGATLVGLGVFGPAGASATPAEWLAVKNQAGTVRYIPLF